LKETLREAKKKKHRAENLRCASLGQIIDMQNDNQFRGGDKGMLFSTGEKSQK